MNYEHQIIRRHLVRSRQHRDEQVVPFQLRADGLHAQRFQPRRVVGDADGTELFELAQQKPRGVTVGIDPLLPLPAGFLRTDSPEPERPAGRLVAVARRG